MVALCLALGLTACILSFQFALDRHFVRSGRMPRGAMVLAILSAGVYISAVVGLWVYGAPTPAFSILAAGAMALSLLLFHATRKGSPPRHLPVAFEQAMPRQVVAEGAHKYVRHPFYASYMLYWAAVGLSAPHAVTIAGAAIIIVLYVVTAIREERKLLNSPLGPAYREYRQRTGMFFPRAALLFQRLRQ